MYNIPETLIADSRLAFIHGKYEESLKLAKQALADDSKNSDQCAGNAYMSFGDCALKWEWDYLMGEHGFSSLIQIGDFWYGIQ
ncbi:MAG: hypothetical protein LUG83_02835 [Lachnospiraceae bacterium]|nr:hypothetical protein [Lachnospiraceae bacterium]